jgi:SAM-dependent methyltransferase
MFYPNKIKSIGVNDRVLEIGPGNSPFHRSDVLLELSYENEVDRIKQFGHNISLKSDKQIVFYDGIKFPFADNAFDYIICSHVLEHISDVDFFLSEVFRVAKQGYFEYPLLSYDYLYNFDVHLNFLKFKNDQMFLMKKNTTSLNDFLPIQHFFLKTLNHNYGDFLQKIPHCFFEGFEWNKPFELKYSNDLNDFIDENAEMTNTLNKNSLSIKSAFGLLLNAVKNKIKNV